MAWYEVALLGFIAVVVWFSFGGNGGMTVVNAVLTPLDLLFVPIRAIRRISKDETKPRVIQLLAKFAVKGGLLVLGVLCFAFVVLYMFRRAWPRLL